MSIADFFLSPLQQRILAPLLLSPDRTFKFTELLRLSGPGRGAGQLQIQKMIKAGLISEEVSGTQRNIKINERFPLYRELRSICMKTFGLKNRLRDLLQPVATSIEEAFIFGSVARGEDRPRSDIDLMIIGNIDLISLMDIIAPAEQELGRMIDVNLYTPTEWKTVKEHDSVIIQILQTPTLRIIPDDAAS